MCEHCTPRRVVALAVPDALSGRLCAECERPASHLVQLTHTDRHCCSGCTDTFLGLHEERPELAVDGHATSTEFVPIARAFAMCDAFAPPDYRRRCTKPADFAVKELSQFLACPEHVEGLGPVEFAPTT